MAGGVNFRRDVGIAAGLFRGAGASGSWAPKPTLKERWSKTYMKRALDALIQAERLPERAIKGQVEVYPGLTSRKTIEEAADFAGLAGTGGLGTVAARPVNSIGIFGGRFAKTADRAALKRAEKMAAEGASREDIHAKTGWFKGTDKQWRFEIDDSTAQMNPNIDFDAPRATTKGTIGQAISHPELFKAYPNSQNIPSTVTSGGIPKGSYKPLSSSPEHLEAGGYSPESLRRVTLHELQHAVQFREGFARDTPVRSKPYQRITADSPEYHNLASEVEARNVDARRNLTPAQRAAMPPWTTQDVPETGQIIHKPILDIYGKPVQFRPSKSRFKRNVGMARRMSKL